METVQGQYKVWAGGECQCVRSFWQPLKYYPHVTQLHSHVLLSLLADIAIRVLATDYTAAVCFLSSSKCAGTFGQTRPI